MAGMAYQQYLLTAARAEADIVRLGGGPPPLHAGHNAAQWHNAMVAYEAGKPVNAYADAAIKLGLNPRPVVNIGRLGDRPDMTTIMRELPALQAKIASIRSTSRIVGDDGIVWGQSFIPFPFSSPADYSTFISSGKALYRFGSSIYGAQYYPTGDLRRFLISPDYAVAKAAWPTQMALYADAPMRASQHGGFLTGLVSNPLFQAVAVLGGGVALAANAGLIGAAASGGTTTASGAVAALGEGGASVQSALAGAGFDVGAIGDAALSGALKSGAMSYITTGKISLTDTVKGALSGGVMAGADAAGVLAGSVVDNTVGRLIVSQGTTSVLNQLAQGGRVSAGATLRDSLPGVGEALGISADTIAGVRGNLKTLQQINEANKLTNAKINELNTPVAAVDAGAGNAGDAQTSNVLGARAQKTQQPQQSQQSDLMLLGGLALLGFFFFSGGK